MSNFFLKLFVFNFCFISINFYDFEAYFFAKIPKCVVVECGFAIKTQCYRETGVMFQIFSIVQNWVTKLQYIFCPNVCQYKQLSLYPIGILFEF